MQDFKRPPIHINAVPAKSLEEVKEWLDSVDIPYSEGPVNLNWPQIVCPREMGCAFAGCACSDANFSALR